MLKWISLRLPRSWRLSLLEALAYPEFEVRRGWVVADPSRPDGIGVEYITLEQKRSREAEARALVSA
jgi:hypothetical protein